MPLHIFFFALTQIAADFGKFGKHSDNIRGNKVMTFAVADDDCVL